MELAITTDMLVSGTHFLPDTDPEDGVLCQLLASGPADPYETCSLFFVEAIHAALLGGYLDVLVTDEDTAQLLAEVKS